MLILHKNQEDKRVKVIANTGGREDSVAKSHTSKSEIQRDIIRLMGYTLELKNMHTYILNSCFSDENESLT